MSGKNHAILPDVDVDSYGKRYSREKNHIGTVSSSSFFFLLEKK